MAVGAILLERGLISQDHLQQALDEAHRAGERLDRALVRLGIIDRAALLEAIADQFHIPLVDLESTDVPPEVLALLPAKLVYRQRCVPIRRDAGVLTVATSDPFDIAVLEELKLLTGLTIELALADDEELHKFIRVHYGVGGDTLDAMSAGLSSDATLPAGADADVEQAHEASVIKLVNDLLSEAISERATDIHIEPYEHALDVRYRIDGVLQKANVPVSINRFGTAIISRLKIMASLNIAEKRKPQDGRITFRTRLPSKSGIEEFDLRVSTIPMLFGEGVVLRVLSKASVLMSLDQLGMPEPVHRVWRSLIDRPHGILLVTGPTGSGKSTTLYASLNTIVSEAVKVITIEDPVEYHVRGVNQIQVNTKVGLDFAAGLRSILRHDPDVVMIGEIRDKETAETAIQASLTGHLVFSTLHTNDAAGAATRLLDMGVEPFLVSSSVEGILAQRLVRRICAACSASYAPIREEMPADLPLPEGATLSHGTGCRNCRNTGYRGRLGVYELMRVSDHVRELVMKRSPGPELARRALADGDLTTLRQDGITKVLEGKTTIEEVVSALVG
jgi:type II secretory ATPase GspE/PulE/Tfp pilus assembly ATPase PilB-like protein